MRIIVTLLAVLVIAAAAEPAAAAPVLYVADGGPTVDCREESQDKPFGSVADALACVVEPGTVIQIGAGTFKGQFAIDKNVTLAGAGAATVIKPPAGGDKPNVAVAVDRAVLIRNLT